MKNSHRGLKVTFLLLSLLVAVAAVVAPIIFSFVAPDLILPSGLSIWEIYVGALQGFPQFLFFVLQGHWEYFANVFAIILFAIAAVLVVLLLLDIIFAIVKRKVHFLFSWLAVAVICLVGEVITYWMFMLGEEPAIVPASGDGLYILIFFIAAIAGVVLAVIYTVIDICCSHRQPKLAPVAEEEAAPASEPEPLPEPEPAPAPEVKEEKKEEKPVINVVINNTGNSTVSEDKRENKKEEVKKPAAKKQPVAKKPAPKKEEPKPEEKPAEKPVEEKKEEAKPAPKKEATKPTAKKPAEKKAAPKKSEEKPEPKPANKKPEPAKEEKPAEEAKEKVSNGKTYHISRRADLGGKWQVKAAGAEKALKLFDTQKEAIDYAKQFGSYRIHSMTGKMRKG